MRAFEESHPWLRFAIRLDGAPPRFWLLLGEARSKCEHIAGVPLRPEVGEKLHRLFLAKGALGSTAIEGNTLSEAEVLRHLEGTLTLPPSREYLRREVQNVVAACNQVIAEIGSDRPPLLSVDLIRQFNRQVLDGLELGPGVVPGEIRDYSVGVAAYRGAPAADCEFLLQRLCDWLNGPTFTPPDADDAVIYAIIRAVVAHVYLAWIHPFGDGNGRTARMLEFTILVTAGVPTPAAHLLSNHYNQTRADYYRQLAQSSRSDGDLLPFVTYAAQGFVDGLREQLLLVREQQLDVAWENFVHDAFRDRKSPSDRRRRILVLQLSAAVAPVPKARLREISPQVAVEYANKTEKTFSRDLNELRRMGLAHTVEGGWSARKDRILAFLPLRHDKQTPQRNEAGG